MSRLKRLDADTGAPVPIGPKFPENALQLNRSH
ncbi:protein of unknown function [Methylocella tundrae]|uniref:Uncharacterized protein n=1 Tax=Methylocella tundrae TaxID=227605 RepID=A0A4U8Z7C0_METTU|nr:protein of unknown function [Methylocella tundrae]